MAKQKKHPTPTGLLWFRAKRYGWGWTPASWEGWIVTVAFVVFIVYRALRIQAMFDTTSSYVFRYGFEMMFAIITLICVCFLTGEKPRWRWGK